MVTTLSSKGWRSDFSDVWLNSGSSSKNRTLRWLSVISPGLMLRPPPTTRVGDGVVRCPKGVLQHQRAIGGQSAADAVYLGDFQSFFRRYPGQYGQQTPGQHGLAAARRPIEQQIVETRRRYLQCSLGVILALDVCQVHGIGRAPVIVRGSAVRRDGRDSVLSPEVLYQSGEIGDGINFHALH